MLKYILFILCIVSVSSCQGTPSPDWQVGKNTTVTIQENIAHWWDGAMDVQVMQKTQKEQQQKWVALRSTTFKDCDSKDFTKGVTEEVQKKINASKKPLTKEQITKFIGTVSLNCKIRAIVRDNLDCSLLSTPQNIQSCDFAKWAVKDIQAFQEKKALYDYIVGYDKSSDQETQDTFTAWW